jgi:galactosyl transferase GMA12/MNN10 family
MKIGVITATDVRYGRVDKITCPVNSRYCQDHGYEWTPMLLTEERSWAETVWQKIPILRKWLERYDWLMWIDADAMVMNHRIKIERLLGDAGDRDLVISSDLHGLNAGVFILRDSEWSRKFLEDVDALKPEFLSHKYPEQEAMSRVLHNEDLSNWNHVYSPPQWLLNQFWLQWIPGDFIIHHAGGSVEDKVKGLTPFLSKVEFAR